MKDKTCIKRKHIFLGSLLAYPIGHVLYSWYYWITNLGLVEHYRSSIATDYGYTETSLWDYINYPFMEATGLQEASFFMSILYVIAVTIFHILSYIYYSKFMNKCMVKRKYNRGGGKNE